MFGIAAPQAAQHGDDMTGSALSLTRLIAAAAVFALAPGLALAAAVDTPRLGTTLVVKGQVAATIDKQPPHVMRNGEDVLGGERISTGFGSSAVIRFLDNSTFQIGPNASVVLNPAAVRPINGGAVRSVTVDAGAFRSVTAMTAAYSQTIVTTRAGAFTSGAAVVVGEASSQRIALFPIDGPGTFVYAGGSLEVPKGGALIADPSGGRARTVVQVAADPATTALMADAMNQLGPQTAVPTATAATAAGPVDYLAHPTGAVAGLVTDSRGYIDSQGGALSKEEIAPETQVAAVQNFPPQPPLPPELVPQSFPPPPLPPPIFASPH